MTRFTPTEVDARFGSFYTDYHSKISLDNGDEIEIGINGATQTFHVKYGATATS